jgi:hypothetical protein
MAIEDEQTEDLNNESSTQTPFEKEGYHASSVRPQDHREPSARACRPKPICLKIATLG